MKYYMGADGPTVRVILADRPTDESTRSLAQCATGEGMRAGAVLGLDGPRNCNEYLRDHAMHGDSRGAISWGTLGRFLARRVSFVRLPGGGESRDIWRLGPICVKRWSPLISPAEVRLRCRVSREVLVCNRMWYVPWPHWTLARWIVGEPATHEACNRLLARFPGLRDLHPGNVMVGRRGGVAVDFGVCDRP